MARSSNNTIDADVRRRTKANARWEAAMAKARLPMTSPNRITYPEAAKIALKAWRKEMGNS